MTRKHGIFLLLGFGFLLFLYVDLRIRYASEQQRRSRITKRMTQLRQSDQELKNLVRQESRRNGRTGKRLFFTGGIGEVKEFPEPFDRELIAVAMKVAEDLVVERDRSKKLRRRQRKQEAGKGDQQDPKTIKLEDEETDLGRTLKLAPEHGIREAAAPLLAGDYSESGFHAFFSQVFLWGDIGEGINVMTEVAPKAQDDPAVRYYFAQAYLLQAMNALTQNVRYASILKATSELRATLAINPGHAQANLQLGYYLSVLPLRFGQVDAAIDSLSDFVWRGQATPPERAEATVYLAELYLRIGQTAEALEAINKGSTEDPENEVIKGILKILTRDSGS